MQMPFSLRTALSFEFSEAHLVNHLDYMRPIIRMLAGLGCRCMWRYPSRSGCGWG
ncbi:regulatory protein CsrD [Vibrio cholerae]|nr:regulatory protein CsrD [Vibrio cholerae]